MSISPPSDIVLDVARAADPVRYRRAVEQLGRAPGPVDPLAFDASMQFAASPSTFDPASALMRLRGEDAAAAAQKPDAYRAFEAMTLSSFVQTMLPTDASAVFGTGTAGDIWKSMLAERIGAELAKSDSFGIAAQLASAHPAPMETIPSILPDGGAGGSTQARSGDPNEP